MRLYLPATLHDVERAEGFRPSAAHAVTSALATALEEDDEEALEFAALLAAADASVALLGLQSAAPRRRVVLVADLPGFRPVALTEELPSAVEPPPVVQWRDVVSLHVDEADAEADVAAAALGDGDALDRASERDMLWFDVSELDAVRRMLGPGDRPKE